MITFVGFRVIALGRPLPKVSSLPLIKNDVPLPCTQLAEVSTFIVLMNVPVQKMLLPLYKLTVHGLLVSEWTSPDLSSTTPHAHCKPGRAVGALVAGASVVAAFVVGASVGASVGALVVLSGSTVTTLGRIG